MERTLYRSLTLERKTINTDAREVWASVSSETPVERGFGLEVLEHSENAIDMKRASQGLALLLDHDHREQIGIADQITIAGKRLRAKLRFSSSTKANEIWSDVQAGIRRHLSIGYQIMKAKRDGDTVRITKWQPVEISLVSIPADITVGIGRSILENVTMENEDFDDTEHGTGAGKKLSRSERKRLRAMEDDPDSDEEILSLGRMYVRTVPNAEDLALGVIARGGTSEDLKGELRKALKARKPEPVPSAPRYEPPEQRVYSGYTNHNRLVGVFGADQREAERNAYVAGMWFRGTMLGDETAKRWLRDYGSRTMTSGSFGSGGALVPDEMSSAIINLRDEFGLARRECRNWPMGSDTLTIPRRKSGVSAYFVGEEDQLTASETGWDNVILTARKLGVLVRVSYDLAEDATIDLASHIAEEIAHAFAEKEDDCLINGDGTSTYGGIQGIRSKILGRAGAVTAAAGHDTYAEIDADDLHALMAKLPRYAHRGAKFYCSQAGYQLVFQSLAIAAGGATMVETGQVQMRGFSGYPIEITEKMPTTTGDLSGEAMILFGNMSQAASFGTRRDMRFRVDESRYLEYDQIALHGTQRFDINVHDVGDASDAGPIVALIGE